MLGKTLKYPIRLALCAKQIYSKLADNIVEDEIKYKEWSQ